MCLWRLLLAGLLALVCTAPALAQNPAPRNPLAEADTLIRDTGAIWMRDFARVDAKLRQALRLREQALGPTSAPVADVLGMLGRNAWNAGTYPAAEQWLRRQLALEERNRPESFEASRALGDLGATLREMCRLEEAGQYVEHSLAMRRRLLGPTDGWVGASLDNLSRILEMQSRLPEAEARAEEALTITDPRDPRQAERTVRVQCLRRMQEPGWVGEPCWPRRCRPVS